MLALFLASQYSNACSIGEITSNTFVTASSRLSCNEASNVTHKTVALSKKTFGGWQHLNSDTESSSNGVTFHANAVWGFPLRHICAIEYYKKSGSSFVGFGWSGDIICL